MPDIGVPELLIILLIVLLVFGPGRLGEAGGALGKAIHEFRRGLQSDKLPSTPDKPKPGRNLEATGSESKGMVDSQ